MNIFRVIDEFKFNLHHIIFSITFKFSNDYIILHAIPIIIEKYVPDL